MITLSTREVRRLLNNVIPFAGQKEDDPAINCVRLRWDGTTLVASSTDRHRAARWTWTADDEDYDAESEPLIRLYGAETGDPPFNVRIGLEDAKNIVRSFALKGPKKQFAPVRIDIREANVAANTYTVKFRRGDGGDSWKPLGFDADGLGAPRKFSDDMPETDIEDVIASVQDIEAYLPGIAWTPSLLAAFGKIDAWGPLEMAFTGEGSMVRFKIGDRFSGVIMPVKTNETNPERVGPDDEFEFEDDE